MYAHARTCLHTRTHAYARASIRPYANLLRRFRAGANLKRKDWGILSLRFLGRGAHAPCLGKQASRGEQVSRPSRLHTGPQGAHIRRCPQARDSLKKKQSCFFRECAKLLSEVLRPVAHPRTRRGARAHTRTRIRERAHAPACARLRLCPHTYGGRWVCVCVPTRCSLPLTSC